MTPSLQENATSLPALDYQSAAVARDRIPHWTEKILMKQTKRVGQKRVRNSAQNPRIAHIFRLTTFLALTVSAGSLVFSFPILPSPSFTNRRQQEPLRQQSRVSLFATQASAVADTDYPSTPSALRSSLPATSTSAATAIIHKMELTIPFVHITLSPLELVLLTLLATLVVAILQATAAVIRYRSNFGDAPLPIVPSHGVVVAKSCKKRKHANDKKQDQDEEDERSSSLRLLLVGDSLAVGVGQSVKCTPVMPEVISRELSRATGKAVFWTCHGESGASAGWIIRELERGVMMDQESERGSEYDACVHHNVEVEGTTASDVEILEWEKRLNEYRHSFDPNGLGPYDIVVVLTGTNDLKIMLFPFLIIDEDKELRKRMPKGGFIEDLQALIQTINERMKRSVLSLSERAEQISRRIRGNTEEFDSLLSAVSISTPNGTVPEASDTTFEDEHSSDEEMEANGINGLLPAETPLFVLPAMPIRTSPSIQRIPLRWLTIPVFDRMEAKKRKLAKANPGEILWVNDPELKDVIAFEEGRGPLWEQYKREEIILSLRCVRGGAGVKEAMTQYYQNKSDSFDTVNDSTPLYERPGRPGTKVYCADRIHPNEAGYELWALHIANAIIADIKKRKKRIQH